MAPNSNIGSLGEDITCEYLLSKEFQVERRNYRKKWGEIDIVARKGGTLYFVEVKAVSRATEEWDVIRETTFQPEDAIGPWKIKRLQLAIQSYLLENKLEGDNWKFAVAAVFLDMNEKKAKIRFIEDIPLV